MAASAAVPSAAAARAPSAGSWTRRSPGPAAPAAARATSSPPDRGPRASHLRSPGCLRSCRAKHFAQGSSRSKFCGRRSQPIRRGMRTMQGDARVIEYLNRGLRHELAAINQYWLHYRLLENWGYRALAKKWRKESIEEMEHADKIVERIIFLDGFPNMQVIDPLHIGQNVKGVIENDLKAEIS